MDKLLGKKKCVTTILYRGSDHGMTPKEFHSRSDNRKATISLFKIKDGDCIGGITNAQWSSSTLSKCVRDNDAFLFNLSRQRHFPSKQSGTDIWCQKDVGPCFGSGEASELCTNSKKLFNQENGCQSSANRPGYGVPVQGDKINMLTNLKDGNFTISELEVWEVIFINN